MVAALILAVAGLPRPATGMSPDIERAAEQGAHELYNLEFDRARETFARLRTGFPGHPAGPTLLATAIWWQARYWYRTPSEGESTIIAGYLDEAIRLSRSLAGRPDTACEGQFFLGGALGVRAHWQMLKGKWAAAAMGARESILVLRPLVSCSPFGEEAYFGLGLYEYAASQLPWTLRWLSRFVVGRSNRAEALNMLERAADRSRWMRTDAQGTLALLYTVFDPAPERALIYAEMMIRERPTSPLAHSLYAQALAFSGRWTETLAETARDLEAARTPGSTFAHEAAAFHYDRGIALLGLRRLPDALAAFTVAVTTDSRAPWISAVHLKRGNARDLAGDRKGAVEDYKKVLKLPDPWHSHKRAKEFLKRPFSWAEFTREITPHGGY
jgi:tetratricopeptide (TPR) repeat protein